MSILDALPAWREHLEDVAAARAEVDRLTPVADRVTAEHAARMTEHREAVADALAASQIPPPEPPPMSRDAHRAVGQARERFDAVRRSQRDVLAGAVDDIEALVRERAETRDKEARDLTARLEALAAEQRADSSILARARDAAHPGRTPSWSDRTHNPSDVHEYLVGILQRVPWADLVPLERFGVTPRKPVQVDHEPWHQSRAGQPLAGPEYADLRAHLRNLEGRGSPGYPVGRW